MQPVYLAADRLLCGKEDTDGIAGLRIHDEGIEVAIQAQTGLLLDRKCIKPRTGAQSRRRSDGTSSSLQEKT
jgi:hypothetical protein